MSHFLASFGVCMAPMVGAIAVMFLVELSNRKRAARQKELAALYRPKIETRWLGPRA